MKKLIPIEKVISKVSDLLERYTKVCEEIRIACKANTLDENSVSLIAVSKFHPIESIEKIASYGQKDFGENYIQEALAKIEQMPNLNWHAIGPIQSKKTKDIVGKFTLLHTLATESFQKELEKRVPSDAPQEVLLQINIGKEDQKAGILPEQALPFLEKTLLAKNIRVTGLMCLPPLHEDPEVTRPYFIQMRQLRDNLEKELRIKLPQLSMGMSGDFKVAIAEGATIIRVGTDIFGSRPNPPTH